MTVSTQVSRNEYTGNGATTQYDFTFRILDKSHLLVQTLDTSESIVTLTLGTDYTVTGVNRYNGGKVVLTSALPAGYKISIERSTPVTQETSIRNQGGFFPEIHEDAFDKLTMLVQQAYGWWSGLSLKKPSWLANYYDALNNRIRNLRDPSQDQDAVTKSYADGLYDGAISYSDAQFERTLRVPESSVGVIPGVAARKNHILAFNSTGNPITVLPESGSAADVLIDLGSSEEGLGDALVMHHDGKTVSEHIDDYLDLRRNVTTLKALKITADGSTDQTAEFQAVLDSLATQGEYWCIDGNGATLVISDMLTIDVARVGLRNIDIHHIVETSSTAVYAMKIDGSAFDDRRSKGRFAKWEGVRLYGAVNRNKSNVHGVLIEASNSIAQVVLQDIDVQRFNCGLVFASNTYLTIIRNWAIHNCHICWATTAYTTYLATGVMGANLTNAGENIRFIDCLFSDSDILMRPYGIEAFVHFLNTSFDYSGSTVDASLVQAEGFRQGTSLFFTGCHFESGNAYDNWTGIFFKVNTSVAVFIAFSTFRASNTYNAAPYFFYDEGTYGQFSIEDCNIWGQGVIWWSNRGLTKFYPMINVQSSAVRGYISEKSDLISDPDFSLSSGSNLVDNWHVVDGTRTAAVVSDVLSCAVVSHTDGAGNTYSALKITKLKASAGATLRLYVKAPRTDFAPLGHVSMCADSVITPAGVVSVAVGLAKTKGLLDAYGMPALSLVVPKLSMTVTSVGTTMTRVNARGVLTKSDDNNGYDLMFLSVNLGGLSAGDIVYITGVNIETPKRA
ncbi:phage tail fiber protein [Klebsiella variicola]|uniref:phage tail fiber domain-containing protein n=1 Tax=Klebsiella variicola TaxID=244366 RepID=UPI0035A2565B